MSLRKKLVISLNFWTMKSNETRLNELNQNRTFGNVFLEYDILDGLTFKTYMGVDANNYKRTYINTHKYA